MSLSDYKDGLYFVPLGGSEQFGVNLNVYIAGGKMLAIDCGIGFADERFPGIDLLLPDPAFLEKHKKDLVGMIITHAHEDHVGAVAHLWPRLKCPVYTTPFTMEILKRKLGEHNVKKVPLHIVEPGAKLSLAPFECEFLPVAHSIPDACAIAIEAAGARVLHSGDWNLDPAPVVGYKTEKSLFQALGKKGVDAYVGDSTNSDKPGRAGSEAEVEDGLFAEIDACEGRVFVTTFASNIGRVISIIKASERAGRSVAVVGRSLDRMIGAAVECGYMGDLPDFIAEEDVQNIADANVVVVCTGSQGESRAAMARIARGDHRSIDTKRGDTVIFSARTIPGNDMAINDVKNDLISGGVRVIGPGDTPNKIHVSGHPCQDEILDMWSWIKPKAVIPVHGERMQLEAHAALAATAQIPVSIVPKNGSVIKLGPGAPSVVDNIETGVLAVDQKRIIVSTHPSIVQRRKLQYTGIAHISLVVNAKGKLLADPLINTIGLIDNRDEEEMRIEDQLYDEILDVFDDLSKKTRSDDEAIAKEVAIAIKRLSRQILGIRPKTTVHVLRV